MRLMTAVGASLIVSFTLISADKTQPLNVKLGLWQMTSASDRHEASPLASIAPELLAKMTPEQRVRVAAKLKARAAQGPRLDTKRFCLTEEKLNADAFDGVSNKSCQRTVANSSGKVTQFRDDCEENGVKRTVDGRFEALDPEAMKGSLKIKMEGSKTQVVNVDIAMKWLGADCGDTAPASSYSKR